MNEKIDDWFYMRERMPIKYQYSGRLVRRGFVLLVCVPVMLHFAINYEPVCVN